MLTKRPVQRRRAGFEVCQECDANRQGRELGCSDRGEARIIERAGKTIACQMRYTSFSYMEQSGNLRGQGITLQATLYFLRLEGANAAPETLMPTAVDSIPRDKKWVLFVPSSGSGV